MGKFVLLGWVGFGFTVLKLNSGFMYGSRSSSPELLHISEINSFREGLGVILKLTLILMLLDTW